jgi:outer membrane protein assembly factor BamB
MKPLPIQFLRKKPLFVKVLTLLFVFLSLSACSSFSWNPLNWFGGDDEVNPPVELQAIQAEISLQTEWSVNIGNGQGSNYTEITPAIDGDLIFAASEDGDIAAIATDTGDLLWRKRLRTVITGGFTSSSPPNQLRGFQLKLLQALKLKKTNSKVSTLTNRGFFLRNWIGRGFMMGLNIL